MSAAYNDAASQSSQWTLFDDFDEPAVTDEAHSNAHIWNPNVDTDEWIHKLEPTDADALALSNLQPTSLTTEQAARLWAKLAAWAQSDQIAYYVEDAPTSSDAAYDARIRAS